MTGISLFDQMDFYTLLAVHCIITALFFLLDLKGKDKIYAAVETMIVLTIPVFGLFIMLIYKLGVNLFYREEGEGVFEREQKEAKFVGRMHYDEDIVPLNDTFLVDDPKRKRNFFTEAIKQDLVSSQGILNRAVRDEDREISYYAVSMLTTRVEKLAAEIYEQEGRIEREGRTKEHLEKYAEQLKTFLDNGYGDAVSRAEKREAYILALDDLIAMGTEKPQEYFEAVRMKIGGGDDYFEAVRMRLQIEDFEGAEKVCQQFLDRCPEREEPYLLYISFCQAKRDADGIQHYIQKLKGIPRELSKEALDVIRFWDRGVRHEE